MLDNRRIVDYNRTSYTKDEFLLVLKEKYQEGYKIFIGSDSKIRKNKISLVTCLVLHKFNTGAKIFYFNEKISKRTCPNLRTRMLLEAYRSIELAMDVEQLGYQVTEIHLDVGSTIKSKTSLFEAELQSIVLGQGYRCAIKPYSWASSAVADKFLQKRSVK